MKRKSIYSSRLPDAQSIALLRQRPGVWLTFAGSAYLFVYGKKLQPLGLKPNWVTALAFVAENPGCTQAGLGRAMGINRASSMALSVLLAEAGFLERAAQPGRPQTTLALTQRGRTQLTRACAIEDDLSDLIFGGMNTDAREHFIKNLKHVAGLVRSL